MKPRYTAALALVAAFGLAACAPQQTNSPPAAANAPAGSMPGMTAAEHQRMMQQGMPGMQGMQGMQGMTAEQHQRMMQNPPRQ